MACYQWFDPVTYIYEERDGEFVLTKSVDLQINALVKFESVGSENSDVFFVTNPGIRPGNSNDILLLNNCTVIIYRKGLDEQVQNEITNNNVTMPVQRLKDGIPSLPLSWTKNSMSCPETYCSLSRLIIRMLSTTITGSYR